MALQLRDNLYWCKSDGRAVFLDMEADRYFCLPAAANRAFLRLASGGMQAGDAEHLQPLLSRGLLIRSGLPAAVRQPPVVEPPTHDLLPPSSARAAPCSIVQSLLSEIRTARLLRRRPLIEVVETARQRAAMSAGPRGDDRRMAQRVVKASNAISYVLRVQDRCLVRALAVHSTCRRKGIRSTLVFGVIAHPFAAHCWVQLGNAVLVGGYEQARLYTPILVLE